MVFVTVGNATQGFRRLLDAVAEQAKNGVLKGEMVFIQSGHNPDFSSNFCQYRPFLSIDEFDEKMAKADLIICHGGCTQLQAVRMGKIPVVMPRQKKCGEHVNDHQVQLVQTLASEKQVVPAYEPKDLPAAIIEARNLRSPRLSFHTSDMFELVRSAMKELVRF
jgi:UDP-N-acetylglucosamine transferase subunit ALG13